jgi:hypothetical protein
VAIVISGLYLLKTGTAFSFWAGTLQRCRVGHIRIGCERTELRAGWYGHALPEGRQTPEKPALHFILGVGITDMSAIGATGSMRYVLRVLSNFDNANTNHGFLCLGLESRNLPCPCHDAGPFLDSSSPPRTRTSPGRDLIQSGRDHRTVLPTDLVNDKWRPAEGILVISPKVGEGLDNCPSHAQPTTVGHCCPFLS